MLPVSQYEALLAEVRGLRRKAQRVQQLATPLLSQCSDVNSYTQQNDPIKPRSGCYNMESVPTGRQSASSTNAETSTTGSDDEPHPDRRSHMSFSSEPIPTHGTWPERTMWNSDPVPRSSDISHNINVTSVMSFASSSGGALLGSPSLSRRSSQQLEAKVDMVYSLLAMLSGQEHADMGETLLALSTNAESCIAMRQSGCIPLLVQMVQSDKDEDARKKASQALCNLVHSQPDEKIRKREVKILKLLEQTRAYVKALRNHRDLEITSSVSEDDDSHPVQTVAHLMKLSFDELHRQVICTLGGIHTIASLVETEHVNHGSTADSQHCIIMRRYACMALTNLTFGDSGNKALLCSFREFIRALVVQLQSPSDELRQVTASVLRNLSWRADSSSKDILREVGSVTGLMKAAMLDNKENTLKSILSALWNLSAHCTENKSEICSVEGALGFLVEMLTYKSASKSLAIIENSGGILRNISSQIAVRDDYREILRQNNCLQILLEQLKSPSLTIVSNACGTLWNLSAKCSIDQEALWQMGAPAMLRSLNHSKHKMIAMGSSAALKNLLSSKPTQTVPSIMDSTAIAMDLPVLPTLGARKQKALLQDLDQTLSETYENIEKDSPIKTKDDKLFKKKYKPNEYSDYDTDFSSLNLGEPSTSCETKQLSLPYLDNSISSNDLNKNSFLKESDNRSFNVYSDSGLSVHSPKFDFASSSSMDNDKYKILKIKEVSSDEKDHCSLEDVSDSDNQSSLGLEHKPIHDDSSFLSSGLVVCKEPTQPLFAISTPPLPHPKANLSSSNVTMFEGDVNEIDMDDISIHFEDNSEKRDVEKEKTPEEGRAGKRSFLPRSCGIPLPRSSSKPADFRSPDPTKHMPSQLTSTPFSCSDNPNNETPKVAGIDLNEEVSPVVVGETSELMPLSVDEGFSVPGVDFSTEELDPELVMDIPEHFPFISKNESELLLERSCEENNPVGNRMLDPDAMIESLDRFTAELVSQASHLEEKYKDNTWNEDTSPNEVTFPSISGSPPNVITFDSTPSETSGEKEEKKKSNDFSSMNTSTMTQSTLIAMEATKMATVFKKEAEMSHSITSVASLELDKIQPLSLQDSFSPKLMPRKKSLIRRALGNTASSIESLTSLDLVNNSLTNLDLVNPPSCLGEVFDMEGSTTSETSMKTDFLINGIITRNTKTLGANFTDIDNINPPSLFHEITDLCNSLADIDTAAIGSETEVFEDCQTHIDDVTEFSDANSITPLQSEVNSPEVLSPRKSSRIAKRRTQTSERYRTYTIGPDVVEQSTSVNDPSTYHSIDSQTYSVRSSKMTPKERRQSDRSRFETQVVDVAITDLIQQPVIASPSSSPNRSKLRKNFIQKRIENPDRFKTQTLNEPSFPPETDLHVLVQREANLVLKNLKSDDLLECETLSLVSNDDDSERQSGSPVNYRTYHKSWGSSKIPPESPLVQDRVPQPSPEPEKPSKPKIVKPSERPPEDEPPEEEPQAKAIRGKRKPLYSNSSKLATKIPFRPIKSMTTNLVKNVTSSFKQNVKSPPVKKTGLPSTASSGYGTRSNVPKCSTQPKPKLERRGTFTKDDQPSSTASKTRIPTSGTVSKIPAKTRPVSSTSSDRLNRNTRTSYTRSASADNTRKVSPVASGVKRGVIPTPAQRSGSSTSLNAPNTKKQVTSKIASLWKKIEETKNKQPVKKDTRVWIQPEEVILRGKKSDGNEEKRVSRLGSFIVMDEGVDAE